MVWLKVFPMEAKYMIPATGSLVGNSMTVVAIILNCIQYEISKNKLEVSYIGATSEPVVSMNLSVHQMIVPIVLLIILLLPFFISQAMCSTFNLLL
jgi:hypothetical protein